MDKKLADVLEKQSELLKTPFIQNEITERILERTGGEGLYHKFEIDLSVAHTDELYEYSGDRFTVENAPDAVTVKLNSVKNSAIDLQEIPEIHSPFTKFYITNIAGTGTLKLLMGSKGMFEAKKKLNLEVAPNFVIYKIGSTTKALNCNTGLDESINADSATVIQYAFDNVPSGETGTILIKNAGSIYAISKKIAVPDNICCIIQGSLKLDNGVDDSMFENKDYASNTANDNITFIGDGCYIDMNRANNAACSGINGAFTNSRFEGLRIENSSHHGINISGHSQKVIITKCMFKTIDYSGVQCHWDEDDDIGWDDITITDNILDDCAKHAYPSGAIWLSGGDNVICANNQLINVDNGVGIQIYNGDNSVGIQNVIVKGNIITGGFNNIHSYSSSAVGSYIRNITIENNVCKDADQYGIYLESQGDDLEDYSISHNHIYNSVKDGIQLNRIGSGVGITHVLIDGNIIDTVGVNYDGINLTSTFISDIIISNNIIKNITGSGQGIVSSSNRVVINGNHIDMDGATGINTTEDDVIVSNNIIKNDGTRCLEIHMCDNTLIIGNHCSGTCNGIKTQGALSKFRVIGNDFDGCTGTGWTLSGAHADFIFKDNIGVTLNNSGVDSKQDGSTITHGCQLTPTSVVAMSSVQGHICTVSAIGSSNFTIDLVDHAGTPITVNENIYWIALKRG